MHAEAGRTRVRLAAGYGRTGATFGLRVLSSFRLCSMSILQLPGRLVLLAALVSVSPAALAQTTPSDADVAAYDVGYRTAANLRVVSDAFTAERYRDGFRAGLRADSSQIAFALGLQAGLEIRMDSLTGIDPEAYLRGIEAGFAGSPPAFEPAVTERATAALRDSVTARVARTRQSDPAFRARAQQARDNAAASERVLAAAAARPGARVSPTGVVSVVTTPGAGSPPAAGARVSVRYTGRFADGSVFDASPAGETVEFALTGVVPGFAEAIREMQPGETRTVWIPSALAYGPQGAPGPGGQGGIPPNTALEFDITLVSVGG